MKYGAIKDPYSAKDYPAAALLRGLPPVVLPEKYQCRPNEPLMNQGGTSECVCFSMTLIRRMHELCEVGSYPAFDPHALYLTAKTKDGIPTLDGTYPRVVLDIMLHSGMPVKGYEHKGWLCPKSNYHPGYKIGGYWRITRESNDAIKQIIMQYGAVSAACTWYTEWCDAMTGQGIFRPPIHGEGGHNWVIDGWDNNKGWRVCNSWGPIWGVLGVAYMPFEMFRSVVLPEGDVWKMTDTVTTNKLFSRLM